MKQTKTFDKFFWMSLVAFAIVVSIICLFPFLFIGTSKSFDFTNTGQIGDTIGGTMGPFVAIAAAMLTFLAFWVQFKANEQQKLYLRDQNEKESLERFQNHFFELIKLHRENVAELSYKKWFNSDFETSIGRKVFRVIYGEFIECYQEIKRFAKFHDTSKIIIPSYYEKLQALKTVNELKVSIIEMAQIDIAFSIVYYGVGKVSEPILLNHFGNKYYGGFFHQLILFYQLKPKLQFKNSFSVWNDFFHKPVPEMETIFSNIYNSRRDDSDLVRANDKLFRNLKLEKYYGGHQHRLGHYFRHLFQTYKFLNNQTILTSDERYFFGKTLRAQLSTYEQSVLFINSISSLGLRWELLSEGSKYSKKRKRIENNVSDNKLITKYNLIKNLPGKHFYKITYKKYYPKVNFESDEKF